MLFNSTLDDLLYPMTADIYYAEEVQNDYGNVSRKWVFDRTVHCSAITAISESLNGELAVKSRSIEYNSDINFRTNTDIRKDSSGKYHPIGSIAITNIKDAAGDAAWINTENLKTQAGTTKTKYEIKTVIPSFDMFHNIGMYRVYLSRSASQKWENAD